MTWGPGTLVVFSLIYCSHTSVLGSRMRIICQGYMFPFLCFSLSLLKYHEDLYIRECFRATLLFERAFPADSRERIISCYIIFKHVIVRTVTVDVSSSNLQRLSSNQQSHAQSTYLKLSCISIIANGRSSRSQ